MAATAKSKIVWNGAAALRRFLVPIDGLEPFPGNPRLGDVAVIRDSLRRWGQTRAVLVDGSRIVAGHHFVLAAIEEGWTHVAVIPNEFKDEDDARAYSLADNRTHDRGQGYDTELLYAQLQSLTEVEGGLDGTGYSTDDADAMLASLQRESDEMLPPSDPGSPTPRDPSDVHEVVLVFSKAQRDQLETWLQMVSKERGTNGPSETVYEMAKIAALQVNQG